MKLLVALYFFILAIIQLGLFLVVFRYYRSKDKNHILPSPFWLGSLLLSILALVMWGYAVVAIEDVAKPSFIATLVNGSLLISAGLQGLFYYSLNHSVSKRIKIGACIAVAIFLIVFEWLRQFGTFEIRTLFTGFFTSIIYFWQIVLIRQKRFNTASGQLVYILYFSVGELVCACGRMAVILWGEGIIHNVEQIPQIYIFVNIFQIVFSTLSYVAIGGYWTEQFANATTRSQIENDEIRALLKERDTLIDSLVKANKNSATDALSASIAHELNQPLGASNLNIQFLQKKLADGELDPSLGQEVLERLLFDNQRAANIIKSLRSIFVDEAVGSDLTNIKKLVMSVEQIVKPELNSKNISFEVNIDGALEARLNTSEISQVLLNLINNALRALTFSEATTKKITVTGISLNGFLELSVTDNGPGIPLEMQPGLFELFSDNKKNRQLGMGLGLWLCSHIVNRYGGKLWHESPQEGGARFVLRIPLSPA
jgi:signal transduction histidine kinase